MDHNQDTEISAHNAVYITGSSGEMEALTALSVKKSEVKETEQWEIDYGGPILLSQLVSERTIATS